MSPENELAAKMRRKAVAGSAKRGAAPSVRKPRLYEMLLASLRSEILLGTYPVDTPLPSEQSLMDRFAVSRHTVRDALRRLREQGLVESHQGRGTLVVNGSDARVYVHHVNDIGELHDFNVDSRYNDHAVRVSLSETLLQRLQVEAEESWLRVDGMRYEKTTGAAMCFVEIFIPGRFSGIGRLLRHRSGPIYSLIEEVYGETIGEVQQELRALPASERIARALNLSCGDTVVEIKRVYRLLQGRIAEVTFNYYAAATFRFSMKLRRVRAES
jgi:GntR family transcriptional regulator